MPPFRLESIEKSKEPHRKNLRTIYTKIRYNDERIMITDWERFRESEPNDNEPYAQNKINLHASHYNVLGIFSDDQRWKTTTKSMLEQIHQKTETIIPNTNKYLNSYYAFNEIEPCFTPKKSDLACSDFPNDYKTTMQNDYSPPKLYVMKRMSLPKVPPHKFKKLNWPENHCNTNTKFWDDDINSLVCEKQRRYEVDYKVKKMNEL